MGDVEVEETGEETLWEAVAPDQLQERLSTTPAEGMWNLGPTARESLVAIITAPLMGIEHMNAQTWTQNITHSFI